MQGHASVSSGAGTASSGYIDKNVYDAFGRLRKVNDQSDALVEEFKYNGLGQRIGWHYNVDGDRNGVEINSDDPWFWFVHDDQWRIVGTHREGDSATQMKEQFIYHNPGLADPGASSGYIGSVILRDRDNTNGWTGAGDSWAPLLWWRWERSSP